MRNIQRTARALALAALIGVSAGCDFLVDPTTENPNLVPNATLDQLFITFQLNAWFVTEGQLSRMASMWTQQMAGIDRQFADLGKYIIEEGDGGEVFTTTYVGGGLVDIKKALDLAAERDDRVYAGIVKIHQAYMLGTAASTFGDIPFSEAADPAITHPSLDQQAAVYDAVQALLDEAIGDLSAGGAGPGPVDLSFGGNTAAWIAVAHTLKARYHAHWAEVDPGRYAQVLAQAGQGIQDASGDWLALHSTSSVENNLWFQFMRDRSGYIGAGEFLVDLLVARGDPRLEFYFQPIEGEIVGSPIEPPIGASPLSITGVGAQDFNFPIVTCAENAFLAAEAAFETGDAAGAQTWVDRGIECQEDFWGVALPAAQALSLEEIMLQKYMSLFLSFEVWNDYKRTCLPDVETFQGQQIPARLYYPAGERTTNPDNIPTPAEQDLSPRNDNDPNPCL